MSNIDSSVIIRFNPWKHHLRWLLDKISAIVSGKNNTKLIVEFISNIVTLNNNHIDLYTGNYEPSELITHIRSSIRCQFSSEIELYEQLHKASYELVEIGDKSVWVLRKSIVTETAIHIHPAKYTHNSERIYGTLFKTCLLLALDKNLTPTVQDINRIRKDLLGLSPVKDTYSLIRINKTLRLLTDR